MKKQSFVLTFALVLLSVGLAAALLKTAQVRSQERTPDKTTVENPNYTLSGPYTYKNLSIFLVHGPNRSEARFLTLQEALEQKKVIVYETSDVNELSIQNLSDQDVYVQSGDIVKGGQQDRMLSIDLIVPPKSGKIPIAAFCVEHGRWSGRGNEQAAVFSSSADAVATKDIKLAAKRAKSQGAVWENVKVAQDKLSENLGTRVNSTVSESSLQLAVENNKVRETADRYINALSGIVGQKNDAIGYVFAINGQVNSADVYSSSALFRKLWPKLLKASSIEAIAELKQDGNFELVDSKSVEQFLSEADDGEAHEKDVTPRVKLVTRENSKNIFFETRDGKTTEGWIHRNYIRK